MIRTRESLDESDVVGDGQYKLGLTYEELALIGSLICRCKLGTTGWPKAAYDLSEKIDAVTSVPDFCLDASELVNFDLEVLDALTFRTLAVYHAMNTEFSLEPK